MAHVNLGNVLRQKGRLEQAVGHYEEAIRIDPNLARARVNLGLALKAVGKVNEAAGHWEQALRLDPKDADTHAALGLALHEMGRLDEAVSHYEEALRLDPKEASTHNNLGNALRAKGRVDEAVGHYRQAIALAPKYALPHAGLGNVLHEKGKLDEAVAHYRQAVSFDPKYAKAHGTLGQALLQQGQFTEARQATRRCLQLLPADHPLRKVFAGQLRYCERMLALDKRLAAVLAGEARPADAAEGLSLAELRTLKKRHADASRFYADAFAAQHKLADDLRTAHRYNAACCAALAAANQGTDAAKLNAEERTRLRTQALDWLRADLALWARQADGNTSQARAAAQKTFLHWQQDPDLAGVREAAALAKLPEAERAQWQKLWADVAALLQKAKAGGKE
jgi:Tfp pilus assembly protein PilF